MKSSTRPQLVLMAVAALVGGCAQPPAIDDRGEPQSAIPLASGDLPRDWLQRPGIPLELDPASRITLRVYRAGRLARLGHNHVIEAVHPDGRLWRRDDGGGVADLRLRVDRLRVDDPAARAAAGEDFAVMPEPAAIEGTRRNLLGPQVLDAQAWPEIRVLARIDDLRAARPQAEIHLSLRGLGRRYRIPVVIGRGGGTISVSGSVALQQTDLGITPFAALGGALSVRNRIDVDFRIIGRNGRPRLW